MKAWVVIFAVLLNGLIATVGAGPPSSQPSTNEPTGAKGALSKYLRYLAAGDAYGLAGCFFAKTSADRDYLLAYGNLLASERKLLRELLAKFHPSDGELCDDLIYLSDGSIGQLADANRVSELKTDGESATLILKIGGHEEAVEFLENKGSWEIDPKAFFHLKADASPAQAVALENQFLREQSLAASLVQAIERNQIKSTREAVDRFVTGFEDIESPYPVGPATRQSDAASPSTATK
jgi:hypothetical protein